MTKNVNIKAYFMQVITISLLCITLKLSAGNEGHEGHEHGAHHVEIEEKQIDDSDEKHRGHNHDDHSSHKHGEESKEDKEHAPHRDHESHKGDDDEHADHGDGGHSEHSDEVTLTEEAIKLFKLRIDTARRQKLIGKISAPMRVTFNAEGLAHLGTSVSGRVKEIQYRIGDQIRKGDALLLVDSPELGRLQSEFLQKRVEVKAAEISLEVVKTEYGRAKKLVEGNGISQAQFLQTEGKYKVAEGGLLTAKSSAKTLKNSLHLLDFTQAHVQQLIKSEEINSVYIIPAPISGEIIAREVTLGEIVNPGDDALMTIADLSTLWIIASVPDSQMRLVQVGAKASITAVGIGDDRVEGKVSYIAPALDERTRTGQVRIEISNTSRVLRPGMFGTAMIDESRDEVDNRPEIVSLPESAVFTVEGGPAVFVPSEDENNTFVKRAITIGPVIGGNVTVLSGLEEGERYVARGGFILKAELGKEGVAHEH